MGTLAVEVPQGSILEAWGTKDGTGSQPVVHQGIIIGDKACTPREWVHTCEDRVLHESGPTDCHAGTLPTSSRRITSDDSSGAGVDISTASRQRHGGRRGMTVC